MSLLYIRFGNTLSALLAHARGRQARFHRLLADRPTGVRVRTRAKCPEADLRLGYGSRLRWSSLASAALLGALYLFYPEHHPTVRMGSGPARVMHLQHIPETHQRARAPAAPRPSVPLAVEGDEVPDDVTIESTELDLDSMPVDVWGLGIPGAVGPPSDDPMDVSEIDFKPHPVRIVTPEYPQEARRGKMEGRIVLRVLVGKDGAVEKVEVLGGPEVFRGAAEAAAWQFRFRPGKHEGQRRKVWMIMPIEFKLQ